MLEGKFGNCQVDEVLQTVAQGTGTGRLSLEGTSVFGGRVQTTFFLEGAQIVHTEVAEGTPYHALVDLLCLREGSFTFTGGETTAIQDQTVPVADAVLQLTAALDEWSVIRQRIGSVDAVFVLKPDASTETLSLTIEQWQVMARLDGATSIRELAGATDNAVMTVVKTVDGFVQAGLATEREKPAPDESRAPTQPQRRGLFRLWARK
jgi:hypothetical protein